jgi:hypothetical protein
MNDLAGSVVAAKSPNWPKAGWEGKVILRILTRGLGRVGADAEGASASWDTVDGGRDLESLGWVRKAISGGQLVGGFGGEDVGLYEDSLASFESRGGPLEGMVGEAGAREVNVGSPRCGYSGYVGMLARLDRKRTATDISGFESRLEGLPQQTMRNVIFA